MASSQWIRVSKHLPCKICKSADWCSITRDGAVAKCMRVESGCFKSKDDRNGGHYYLHRLTVGPHFDSNVPVQSSPEPARADVETLSEVYTALLARLSLSELHRENLQGRGLDDNAIEKCGFKTLRVQGRSRIVGDLRGFFGDKLLGVPGFIAKHGRSGPYLTLSGSAGLLVPCRDRVGRVMALKVRRDDAIQDRPRYSYISSVDHGGPGPGSPLHFPLGWPEEAEVVRLIEGELKADIVQELTGLPTLSIPGASNWRPALHELKALGCKTVRLAFDVDASDNPIVARGLSACSDALAEAGFAVQLERWCVADGKGLDDLLAAGKTPDVLQGNAAHFAICEISASATSEEEPAPPDELARVQEVIRMGGRKPYSGTTPYCKLSRTKQ